MNTILYSHGACERHDNGAGHPESPERLRAIRRALEAEEFALLDRRDAPRIERDVLALVHDRRYVDAVLAAVPGQGHVHLDGDTSLSPESGEAALRAAGAVCAAVDAVLGGEARNAFCAVRPPGHHATRARAMGFCLFDNVAVASAHARVSHGLGRVAIVDFDVHHGNGTQDIFWDDPSVLYASVHQMPLYPGTGAPEECGGSGNIVNVGLPPGSGSRAFREAFARVLAPAVDAFRPELILVSAGFDGHARDPLAHLMLTEADFGWVTSALVDLAGVHSGGRLVSTLEGGYDLTALGLSVAAHVRALMGG